jgi:hypothetical protein
MVLIVFYQGEHHISRHQSNSITSSSIEPGIAARSAGWPTTANATPLVSRRRYQYCGRTL